MGGIGANVDGGSVFKNFQLVGISGGLFLIIGVFCKHEVHPLDPGVKTEHLISFLEPLEKLNMQPKLVFIFILMKAS